MSISSASDTFSSMKPPVSVALDLRGPVCGAVDGVAGVAAAGWGCAGGAGGAPCCAEATHIPHQAASIAAVMTLPDLTAYSFSVVRLAALFFCWSSQILRSSSFSSVFLRTQVRK